MEDTYSFDIKAEQYLAVPYMLARRELEAVLSDPQFQCSERNKKFLRFVSEELFAGRAAALKAYSIAVDVFGRPTSFDASTDPIVRIEATRLRSALSRYYELYGSSREVGIELPKGRYVPMFSLRHPETEELGLPASSFQTNNEGATANEHGETISGSALTIVKKLSLAATALISVGLFVGYILLSSLDAAVISEKPTVAVDLQLNGANDQEAIAMRDLLMSALSNFSTLRLSAPDAYTASTTENASVASPRSRYRLVLKYSVDAIQKSVWWQVIDQQTGEVLQSDDELSRIEGVASAGADELLVARLATRIASMNGVINTAETRRDLEHPTLGYGCVLRANLALNTSTPQALSQARSCLERTLQERPYDADSHAMLAATLLSIDPPEASIGLTASALEHADRAVTLAPESSRGFASKMMAELRAGHAETAIEAGRRAIALNPYNSRVAARLARILYSTGKRTEGVRLASKALEIDGLPLADAEWTLAFDAYSQGQLGEALLHLKRETRKTCYLADLLLTATLGRLGQKGDASAIIADIRKSRPDFERNFHADMSGRHIDPQMTRELAQGLHLAGLRLQ
ncbi:hypothetical protein [Mesorhizobium sp.]|uniref:hypothetical protein n=1 Tax=Mesorhizobium sp. TaxID=1871066 RepID=UPI000FE5A27D|nr:hypothetical protein [Mesorhizobium sp.]RWP92257.1 MAG: hypothetical protein EOR12_06295 [Mesorhizobium sp.]RWQ15778.1 MAG: hypothetical protein EOR93_25115 [Mesorhizobium sp.]